MNDYTLTLYSLNIIDYVYHNKAYNYLLDYNNKVIEFFTFSEIVWYMSITELNDGHKYFILFDKKYLWVN